MTLPSTFASLSVRNYRLFFLGQLVSLIGSWMQILAQDWLVLELTGNSGRALGTVTTLQFAPLLLLTLYAGLLADRLDKRLVLLTVQSTLLVCALAMGLLVMGGAVELWHVYAFAVLLGVCRAFETPVRQAFASELVGPELVSNAVGLNSAVFNTGRLVGPAVGGVLIALWGTGVGFLVNSLSFVAVICGLLAMRPGELRRDDHVRRLPGQLVEAVVFLWRRHDLRAPLCMAFVIGVLGMNTSTMTLPLLAKAEYHVTAGLFGVLLGAFSVGAIVGALASASRTAGFGTWYWWSAVGFAVMLLLVAVVSRYWLAAALLVPAGVFMAGHNTAANSGLQLAVPARIRGRVMSIYTLLLFGAIPVGALTLGVVADVLGARASAAVVGGGVVLAAVSLGSWGRWRGVKVGRTRTENGSFGLSVESQSDATLTQGCSQNSART